MVIDRENLYFNVLRNALYHTARRNWYERVTRWFNFIVVVLSATAFTGLFASFGLTPVVSGAAIAAIAAYQLAFDPAGHSRDHHVLQREYYRLLGEIEANPDSDDRQLALRRGEMIRITGDEPPTMRAIDAKAYNDAIDATGIYDSDQRLKISLWVRLLGGFFTMDGVTFKKFCEI